jgi:Co/Zn/Cd efflux system component
MIATSTQKTYRGSGIALLLASVCTLIYMLLLLSAPARTESQTLFQSGVFGLTYIFALCALPGIHAKQARRGEWLGTIGIMMLAAGWILTILMSCIIVVKLSSNQLFSPEAMSSFSALFNANFLFLIIGDTILGISVILAGVFPRWTGIALIVVGSLDLINKQYPQVMAVNVVVSVLVVAIFSQWGLRDAKRLNYPGSVVNSKH